MAAPGLGIQQMQQFPADFSFPRVGPSGGGDEGASGVSDLLCIRKINTRSIETLSRCIELYVVFFQMLLKLRKSIQQRRLGC